MKLLQGWQLDLRLAFERLRRDPWTTLALVVVLGLGTGVGGALAGWLQPLLYAPLPYADGDRLVYIWQTERGAEGSLAMTSLPDLRDWADQANTIEGFSGYTRQQVSVTSIEGGQERRNGLAMTHGLPSLLGLQPLLGRTLNTEEDAVNGPPVVVLGYDYWRTRFAADPQIVGQRIELEGEPYEIVGVLPEQRGWALDADLWYSLVRKQRAFADERGVHGTIALGRLADGVSLAAADAEMGALAQRLMQQYPDSNDGRQARVVPMHQHLVRSWTESARLASWLVALLLLTVSVNLLLLLSARHQGRRASLAVQSALGAAPGRLLRQLLIEHLLLGALGLLLAVVLAKAALAWARATLPLGNFDPEALGLDSQVIAIMGALSVALSMLIGLLPARRASRSVAVDALDSGGRSAGAGKHSQRLGRGLQIAQVSFGLVAASAAILLASSAMKVAAVDPGFRAEKVVRLSVELPQARYPFPGIEVYPKWPELMQVLQQAERDLAQLSGVRSLALAQNQPLQSGWTTTVVRSDRAEERPEEETTLRAISPGYLPTVGLDLLSGRNLSASDRSDAPNVVLVNQAFIKRWFSDVDPIGQKVQFWGKDREIVGVVGDVRFAGLDQPASPAIYPPLAQIPFAGFSILAQVDGDPNTAIAGLREALWRIEPGAAVFDAGPLAQSLAQAVAPWRLGASLAVALASVVTALMLTGLFALLAGEVSQRRREIAVRRALGAQGVDVGRWMAGGLIAVLLPGLALGMLISWFSVPLLAALVYGISPHDPVYFLAAGVVVLVVAALAALIPLRRALAVAPMGVLRG